MKNLVGVLFFLTSICSAQFFESDQSFFESETTQKFFQSEEYNESEPMFAFFQNESSHYGYDYGVDNVGNPAGEQDPVPIDHGWFLLVLSGILVGFYFIKKKKQVLNPMKQE
ncbi:hypothetical protein [Moheibacter stercoris]|uniref:LPXTG-motif cell wall anchor domain-containing protein n=1 Tax=Moheibacter stercoris TaxID=1628251 RepID=A0ABV2LS33_9FLAO